MTECSQSSFSFGKHYRRQVSARFDGGVISSDGGALLLREVDQRIKLLPRLAACFEDGRDSRRDPVLALLVGKSDVAGQQRRREHDRGQSLAGSSAV